jgi:hypothetical protein
MLRVREAALAPELGQEKCGDCCEPDKPLMGNEGEEHRFGEGRTLSVATNSHDRKKGNQNQARIGSE